MPSPYRAAHKGAAQACFADASDDRTAGNVQNSPMQDFKQITRNFSISGQISPEDLPRLRERGVKVIINNRPDGEEAGQISSDSLAEAAAGLGLAFYALPMRPGELDPTIMERPSAIRAQADGPVHAFCRTGNRSLKM